MTDSPQSPESPDSRSPMATAMALASQVTAIAAEMAVPPLLGYGLDHWLGTGFVFVVLGAVLGLVVGMMTLLRMARTDRGRVGSSRTPPKHPRPPVHPKDENKRR